MDFQEYSNSPQKHAMTGLSVNSHSINLHKQMWTKQFSQYICIIYDMIKWTGHLIWMLDLLFSYSYSSAEVITIANEVKLYIL